MSIEQHHVTAGEARTQFKTHKILQQPRSSKLASYGGLIVGSTRLADILRYELVMLLCSTLPGALGLLLRSKLYPQLLGHVGKNVVFGTNVTLRHPKKIWIGDNVIIDDNVMLDAKGSANHGIVINDGVFVGRNSILSCKDGDIVLHENANIGFNCEIFSNSKVEVGAHTMLAAYCYLVGGGSYRLDDLETPIAYQDPTRSLGGIRVGAGGWLGAGVTVVDGVSVGDGAVVGAGAVVTKDVADYCVAAGVPAKVVKDRRAATGER